MKIQSKNPIGTIELKIAKTQSLSTSEKPTDQIKKQRNMFQQGIYRNSSQFIDQEDVRIGGGFILPTDIMDALPYFIKEENIMDIERRRPLDPNYDYTTLYIPENEWKGFTPALRQYWQMKQTNFDKILFFKLGKFYEMFHNDAIICQNLLDLNWMGGDKKLHVGFPEKALNKYLTKVISAGHKVAVIEQTETPKQLEQRQKQEKLTNRNQSTDKCIKREIYQVVTKGTFKDPNNAKYEAKYVLSFKKASLLESQGKIQIGVTFFDVSTLKIYCGEFEDNEHLNNFRTLICQIRPVEVIHEKEFDSGSQLIKMLKNAPIVPIFTLIPSKNKWSLSKTIGELNKYLGAGQGINQWPEPILKLKDQEKDLALLALGQAVVFLEDALIAEQILKLGEYYIYEPGTQQQFDYMVLDGQALQHLEIVECTNGKFEGSLLHFVDHCKTTFAKRQLKKWLLSPLMNIQRINNRLDAVENLMKLQYEIDQFRFNIGKLPDLEKLIAKIYSYSIKQRVKAVYFEDMSLKKLKQFRTALKTFKSLPSILEPFVNKLSQIFSQRLKQLLTPSLEGGLIPSELLSTIANFEQKIIWKKMSGNTEEIPEPQLGLDPAFDEANHQVDLCKEEFDKYLNEIKLKMKDKRITWSHAKYRYELEIPEELVKGNKKPEGFEFTSQRQGFQRFHTPKIKYLIERLENSEDRLKDAMTPFICSLFNEFHLHKETWQAVLNILAELDCLIALSIVSRGQGGVMCRPKLLQYENQYAKQGFLDLKGMRHPCVPLSSKQAFIPNDTFISPAQSQTMILVTGPNMGGKSTLLRQTCIAVILAQIGCFVPAESCILTPADRIFTRIGASDRILEGKSTFYVEMEETKNIIQFATFRSLAIIDELGRGTSTFDGYSIAHAVLKYIVNKIKCRSLFSTHYHMLLDEFRGMEGVQSYHMAFEADKEKDQVMFLYKFIKGECPMSFGINVAKMALIPQIIIDKAKKKSENFNQKLSVLTMKAKLSQAKSC